MTDKGKERQHIDQILTKHTTIYCYREQAVKESKSKPLDELTIYHYPKHSTDKQWRKRLKALLEIFYNVYGVGHTLTRHFDRFLFFKVTLCYTLLIKTYSDGEYKQLMRYLEMTLI